MPASTMTGLEHDRERELAREVSGRWGRRAAITALVAFVAVGLLGGLGYRERTARGGNGAVEAVLVYPAVTRGGLPASWSLTIRSRDDDPIGGEVMVATSDDYFGTFDHNDLVPAPDRAWQTADATRWEYDVDGDAELRITLDVRTQPDARWPRRATTVVEIDGAVVASFHYRTWVLP